MILFVSLFDRFICAPSTAFFVIFPNQAVDVYSNLIPKESVHSENFLNRAILIPKENRSVLYMMLIYLS